MQVLVRFLRKLNTEYTTIKKILDDIERNIKIANVHI
jgi:hypothetical protein